MWWLVWWLVLWVLLVYFLMFKRCCILEAKACDLGSPYLDACVGLLN